MDAKARLLAVEVLLADPEQLGNDALEGDLYILRDNLTRQDADAPDPEQRHGHQRAARVPPAPARLP
jgi:hypothetical protein